METRFSLSSFYRRYQSVILILLFGVLQTLIIVIAFVCGYLVRDWPITGSYFAGTKFPVLFEAIDILEQNALVPLPTEQKLEYGMIRGLLEAYNEPFTVFVEPPQHELQSNQLAGKFGGIGVRIERDAENNAFLYPLPGSPALVAGVKDGDRLLAVESLAITPATSNDEIQAAIRGPVGEKVKVTISRAPDFLPVVLAIERDEVSIPSVTWNISPDEPSVGIVQMRVVADTTPNEVTTAIVELQKLGATHFVLDVRNNGGGLVEAGVNTSRLFLKEGVVIQEKYRDEEVKTFYVEKPGQFTEIPLVVLVNKGTASAAEIFAGALQGQGRAKIVGTNTYGKDTIQLVFNLSDGSSLHVTAAQWWVPGLNPKIGGNGLRPDVSVAENADQNVALQTAIEAVLK